jgi:hypothetical protein
MKNSALLVLLGAVATANLSAQGMGGTTPTTGAGGQTSTQANPGLGSGGGAMGPNTSRPIYISGKVVIEDGSAAVQNVTIERVCGGMARTVAYTDSHGRFNFQWGDRSMIVADASDAGSSSARSSGAGGFGSSQSAGGANPMAVDPFGSRMMNCELRANMAGYRSDSVNLFNKQLADKKGWLK